MAQMDANPISDASPISPMDYLYALLEDSFSLDPPSKWLENGMLTGGN